MSRSVIKTPAEIEEMREACRVTARILDAVGEIIKPGISTEQINSFVDKMTREEGAVPSQLNYKGFSKSVCTSLNDVICHGIPSHYVLLKAGDIINVDVKHNTAISRYSLYKLLKLTVETIISYSVFPLRFISVIGFTTSVSSMIGAIFFIYKKLSQDSYILGWTSLIVLNLFFFGLLLLSMGVIGEYSIEREGVIIREKAREYPEIAYFPEVVKCKKPNIANKIKSLLIMRK